MSTESTPSVLLVEDDVRLAELVSRYLENNGLRVTIAVRGDQGVELVSNVCRHRQALILQGRGELDARTGGNVFAELVHAVEVCSLGQITACLTGVVGKFRPMV